jgi:hypothetical protein
MGFPLSCGPVLVWFPATRSIGFTFGLGNQVIYVIRTVPASAWSWSGIAPLIVEPGLNLIGVEP